MSQIETRPTLQNSEAYLKFVENKTLTRVNAIAAELEPTKRNDLLTRLLAFSAVVERRTPILKMETSQQHTQRQGWMIEAAATELLDVYGLRASKDRKAWKNDLVFEILQERQHGEIPGVNTAFALPYRGYLDEYSQNRVLVLFPGNKGMLNPLHTLHIGSSFDEVVKKSESVKQAKSLIAPCNILAPRSDLTAITLLNELAYLHTNQKERVTNIPWRLIKHRLDSFRSILSTDEQARSEIDITYTLLDRRFHAFLISSTSDAGIRGRIPLQIQPEEVNDQFWNFLSTFALEPVPNRKTCLSLQWKVQRDIAGIYIDPKLEDDEWGSERRKVKMTPKPRDRRTMGGKDDEDEA